VLEKVERWVERLPALARELPILWHAGRDWTPLQILEEARKATPLAEELQHRLEIRALGSIDVWQLAKKRLIKAMELQPVRIYRLFYGQPKVIEPERFKREIEAETPWAKSLISIELARMMEQVNLYG